MAHTLFRFIHFTKFSCGPGSSFGIATELRAGRSGIESRWGRDFPPVQDGPGAHPAPGSFPGVEAAGVDPHPHLECWGPRKSRAIPPLTLRVFVAYKKDESLPTKFSMWMILKFATCSLVEIYKSCKEAYSICFGSNDRRTEKLGVSEVRVLPDCTAVHMKRQHPSQSPLRWTEISNRYQVEVQWAQLSHTAIIPHHRFPRNLH